jgi:hypothetical protein
VIDLQIVEDHLNLNLEDDQDIVDEAEGYSRNFPEGHRFNECSVQRKAI